MLFRKKSFKDNIKVSKFKMLDSESAREGIPGRVAISLAAPFVIVGLFLWFFSKQAVVSSPPSPPPSGEAPASVASAALDKQQPVSQRGSAVPQRGLPASQPAGGAATAGGTAMADRAATADAAMPARKDPAPSADIGLTKEKVAPNKPVTASTQQPEILPKEAAPVKVAQGKEKKTPVPPKTVLETPQLASQSQSASQPPVKPVKIKEGRPHSPLEEKGLKSKGTPSKAVSQKAKGHTPKTLKESPQPAPRSQSASRSQLASRPKNPPEQQVAKANVPVSPAVVVPVSPPPPLAETPAATRTPAVTGTSSQTGTPTGTETPAATGIPAMGIAPAPPTPALQGRNAVPVKKEGHSYGVQVGSFKAKEDAQKLAFRLKERGYDVYIVVTAIAEKGEWHRVRIGHYADRLAAQKEGEKILNAERLPFFITSD